MLCNKRELHESVQHGMTLGYYSFPYNSNSLIIAA